MEYDPSHKTSSITSASSISSSSSSAWDQVPSLYTGRADSISSSYDLDEFFILDEDKPTKKQCKELLSDKQKKANHIASEQKRRNTIRGGFKELTELVPTLKNINNSKSIILFKSVEYVKQLNKRNKQLKDTLSMLQKKVKQKQTVKRKYISYHSISIPSDPVNTISYTPALVMPASVDDWLIDQSYSTPSFIIPAMDNDNILIHTHESLLLSSGKLNHLKQ